MDKDAIIAKLRSRTQVDPDSECWNWQGSTTHGYGSVSVEGRRWRVHRLAYVLLVDPNLPDSLVIDHVRARGCRSKACWNPAHLEAVTQRENTIRGEIVLKALARTHCDEGHELLPVRDRAEAKGCVECRTRTTKCARCGSIVLARHLERHQARPACARRAERLARQPDATVECPGCGFVVSVRGFSRHRDSKRCADRSAVSDGC